MGTQLIIIINEWVGRKEGHTSASLVSYLSIDLSFHAFSSLCPSRRSVDVGLGDGGLLGPAPVAVCDRQVVFFQ